MGNQVEVIRTACTQESVHRDQCHIPRGTAEISATIKDLRCSGADPTSLFNPHSLQKTDGSWRMTFVV